MLRQVLAVLAGFILWSVLWLAYNAFLIKLAVLPHDQTQPLRETSPLLALLVGSVMATLAAGYSAAVTGKSTSMRPIAALGLLLLAVGIFVQLQYWSLMPLWYHLIFLSLLLPACIAGARLRKP